MTRVEMFLVAVIAVLLVPGYGNGSDKGQDRLTVSLEMGAAPPEMHVGDAIPLKIILDNKTPGPLLLQDWDTCLHVINFAIDVVNYPGYTSHGLSAFGFGRCQLSKERLRPIPPGPTTVDKTVVPMIPGDFRIGVQIWCPERLLGSEYRSNESVWNGQISSQLKVKVSAEMPDNMKDRYEQLRKRLLAADVRREDQLSILSEVAAEKHYFAAHFVRETYDAADPGRVKEAALRHLVELAQFGTAYESFPLLVKVMEQDDTPQDVRLTLLEWIGKVLARGYQELAEQAFHRYSEPLQEEARKAIGRLAQGRNPLVAAKAQEVLKRLEAKK